MKSKLPVQPIPPKDEPRVCFCGAPENNHPYRHPFKPASYPGSVDSSGTFNGIAVFYDDQMEPNVVRWNGNIKDGLHVRDKESAGKLAGLFTAMHHKEESAHSKVGIPVSGLAPIRNWDSIKHKFSGEEHEAIKKEAKDDLRGKL